MRETHRRGAGWGVGLLGALLCLVCFMLFAERGPLSAATLGSKHDFTGKTTPSITTNGNCSPCHRAHAAQSQKIWPRNLADEITYYDQNIDPNYIPSPTLLCYDCHDDMLIVPNPDPPSAIWNVSQRPQDIAFSETASDSARWMTTVGYYELFTGGLPPGGVGGGPQDGSPTGGHYWKTEPGGFADPGERGDKISCRLCHDPHNEKTGIDPNKNDVFFLTDTTDYNGGTVNLQRYVTTHTASPFTRARYGTVGYTGRDMCAECHTYADDANLPQTFASTVILTKPPVSFLPQHKQSNDTPCVRCHKHNKLSFSCKDCHGFPPLQTYAEAGNNYFNRVNYPYAENYLGGAGTHRRHKDALGDAIFSCEICHGPNPGSADWHGGNSGLTTVNQSAINIMGQGTFWAPSGYPTPPAITPDYNPTGGTNGPASGDSGWPWSKMGGSPQRCVGVACHGNPLATEATQLNWQDDMVSETAPGGFVGDGATICKWCHDKTPAIINGGSLAGIYAPNIMGDSSSSTTWATGNFGADVNGHGLAAGNYEADQVNEGTRNGVAAANKDCAKCHDARYQTNAVPLPNSPLKPHLNATSNDFRFQDNINSQPISNNADNTCPACHQVAAGGPDRANNSQASTHGNSTSGGYQSLYPLRPQFTRVCRQCHDVHGLNWNNVTDAPSPSPRNLHMVGKWYDGNGNGQTDTGLGEEARVDSNNDGVVTNVDLLVRFKASTGADSYDDGDGDAGLHESVCVVCHTVVTHNHVNDTSDIGQGHNVGADCMGCHDHDYDDSATTADAFMPSGCYSCHGTNDTETLQPNAIRRQFWPDGDSPFAQFDYSDNQPGAHRKHVEDVAAQVFGETAAQVVTDYTAGINPTLRSLDKQKVVCAFCHKDPGAAGHHVNETTAPSGASRVDVYRAGSATNYFSKFTTGVQPTYSRTNYTSDVTALDSTYFFTGASAGGCNNLVCHNQVPTPVGANNWSNPPDWSAITGKCAATTCHATGTYTNAHNEHVGAARKNFECLQCHANNNAPVAPVTALGHGNGKIDMVWNNAGAIEAGRGGGNGYYNKDGIAGATTGDTGFAYKNGTYNISCELVYCHGDDNVAARPPDWGGGDTTPVWNSATTAYCGSCHDGNGTGPLPAGDGSVTATGNHTDHLTAAYGPVFSSTGCTGTATTGCHTAFDVPAITATHVDGTVEFDNIGAAPAASPLGTLAVTVPTATDTDRCTFCHSTLSVTANIAGPGTQTGIGAALAKTNWSSGTFELACVTCHNPPATAAWSRADGTGIRAPDVLGNDVNFGAEIRGHNRAAAAGVYPVSSNAAAAYLCNGCHNTAAAHINGTNDTTYTGNRMLTTIMGVSGLTTPTGACNACHANNSSTATKRNVNTHGNAGYAARLEAQFTGLECAQCHDPHGMTADTLTVPPTTFFNIYMVPSTITVVPGTTVANVRFEAVTGNNSFNDTQATPNDDLCVVCHINTANPGYNMNYDDDGQHSATPGYDNDERGSNCSNCHTHNRDNTLATVDGFMTVACNTCHTYPGLPSAGPPAPHLNSTSHDVHVGYPSDVAPTQSWYGFRCALCHYQSDHNTAGVATPTEWAAKIPNDAALNTAVQVRFDNRAWPVGWNPATSNPVDRRQDSSSFGNGSDANNVCTDLYCHGDDNPRFPNGDRGTDRTPDWYDPSTANCGTCHDATAAVPPGDSAHPTHAGNGAGEYAIGCQVCHYRVTNNGTSIASTLYHVDRLADVVFNGTVDARVAGTPVYNGSADIGAGYGDCTGTYCHSNGTDLVAPYDTAGAAAPATALVWNQNDNCWSCHGNGTNNSMPNYLDGAPKANKHLIHNAVNKYGCQLCHYQTTQTGTAIASVSLHVNRIYNLAANTTGPALYQFTGTAPNCNAVACHGGNTAAWSGATIPCDTCHSFAGGALTNTDVNDFSWAGGTPAMSKVGYAEYTQNGGGHGASAPRNIALACNVSSCHDSAVGHDTTTNLSGTNPYRLADQSLIGGLQYGCDYTGSGCHTTGTAGPRTGVDISTITTHSTAAMSAAGWSAKRNWPSWTPQCVNCHDPHGDATNVSMIQKELYDKTAFNLVAPAPAAPTEQTNLVFTDDTTGANGGGGSYADLDSPFSSVCQECHEDASVVSFHDGPSGGTAAGTNHPGTGTNSGDCSSCHSHAGGFAPTECEGCHGGDTTSFAPYATHPGKDGSQGTIDDAPNTISSQYSGTWLSVWDGSWWDAQTSSTAQRGGHGDAGGQPAVKCVDCHDISSPQPNTHFTGTVNTFDYPGKASSTTNSNTSHLKSFFFAGASPPVATAQTTFDNACAVRAGCHSGTVTEWRHVSGGPFAPFDDLICQFGQNGATLDPKQTRSGTLWVDYWTPWTMKDLQNTVTGTAQHGVCVSCHNPHGSTATDIPTGCVSNAMMRYNSEPPPRPQSGTTFFCSSNCHKTP